MKKLVIILTEESTPTGRILRREHIGDTELLDDELNWCIEEIRNDLDKKRALKD